MNCVQHAHYGEEPCPGCKKLQDSMKIPSIKYKMETKKDIIKNPNLNLLNDRLVQIENNTNWLKIAEECSMEKQIEIRAEIGRAIKRINKELKK